MNLEKRSFMGNLTIVIIALVVVCFVEVELCGAASLNYTVTATYQNSPNPTILDPQNTGWSNVLLLPKFDTRLGTLTGAVLTFSGRNVGSITVTASGADVIVSYLTTNVVFNTTNIPRAPATPTYDYAYTFGGTDYIGKSGPQTVLVGTPRTFGPTDKSGNLDYNPFALLAADLPYYSGSGNATIDVSTSNSTTSTITGGSLSSAYSNKSGIQLQAQYTYTGVPEPSTYILLVISLCCVGLVRYNVKQWQKQQIA